MFSWKSVSRFTCLVEVQVLCLNFVSYRLTPVFCSIYFQKCNFRKYSAGSNEVRFQGLAVVTMNTDVFWVVAPCSLYTSLPTFQGWFQPPSFYQWLHWFREDFSVLTMYGIAIYIVHKDTLVRVFVCSISAVNILAERIFDTWVGYKRRTDTAKITACFCAYWRWLTPLYPTQFVLNTVNMRCHWEAADGECFKLRKH
jgi:hypothetical protein